MIRRRVVVTGRVQNVFYRDGCRREALRLGVAGWVANRGDGAVEAVFEGDERAVQSMINWAREGSPRALVVDLQVTEEQPAGERGFRVV